MDLNHDLDDDNYEDYAFGNFMADEDVEMVLVLMNWIKTDAGDDRISWSNVNYWMQRLYPVGKRRVIIACCNRTGTERGGAILINY